MYCISDMKPSFTKRMLCSDEDEPKSQVHTPVPTKNVVKLAWRGNEATGTHP